MARILALSSLVVRGSVGLAATVPALQALGHEVWALPTVTLAARPGLGAAAAAPGGRRNTPPEEMAGMLAALEQDGCWPLLDAVFTGYFATAQSVAAAAVAIARMRDANPRLKVLVDPIIGDAGRLYVPAETATAIRRELLPLADVATPNLFELEWLAEVSGLADVAVIAKAAATLGPKTVVVTSALETDTEVSTLLIADGTVTQRASRRIAGIPNGSGDLLDGLFLGRLLCGYDQRDALDFALDMLERVLEASAGRDVLQLACLARPAP